MALKKNWSFTKKDFTWKKAMTFQSLEPNIVLNYKTLLRFLKFTKPSKLKSKVYVYLTEKSVLLLRKITLYVVQQIEAKISNRKTGLS